MDASTYAWAVILAFFVIYATIHLRKCFSQILSSGAGTTPINRLSSSSVYTIESDARSYRNDQETLGSVNDPNKMKDDLPTYDQVIASDRLDPINRLSSTSQLCSNVSTASGSLNVIASNATVHR